MADERLFSDEFTAAYGDGYSIGKMHADINFSIDPRWSMAEHSRKGTLDAFMRGFDDGYEGRAAQP